MAKQFILSALEETLGEYIANVSKEHLKIAALRGQLSLENVPLDGDLVGSHVLGAFGLSSGSLGVLSCSAKCMKVHIPWSHLEESPTRLEISGVHLVCVPLTPATAPQTYGAGTKRDPRCSLRTRAKRLRLARLERNFWNGGLPGEGPVMKKIQRAVREVERDRKRRHSSKRNEANTPPPSKTLDDKQTDDASMDAWIDSLVHTLADPPSTTASQRSSATEGTAPRSDDLPELPRDWKVKFREKVLRNIEAVFADLHIRLEVPPDRRTSPTTAAFALGFTLDRLVIRTADAQWQVGRHDPREVEAPDPRPPDHLGPNEYVAFNNKIGFFHQLSIYWDDDPPILLSEMGSESVVAAMDALFHHQEPGSVIRQALAASNKTPVAMQLDAVTEGPSIPHGYVCQGLDAEVRVRTSDRVMPGPISCSADVQPFHFTFHVRPSQYLQFQKLMAGVKSQQRFDTMPRQRPVESPRENPAAWWKYAMARVTSRPQTRPWEDVKRIGQSRLRYIELVMKKNADRSSGAGYHGSLTTKQSEELLAMEDSLPMEALLAFHLVALRRVYAAQTTARAPRSSQDGRRFRIRRPSSKSKLPPPSSPSASCDASMALASTTTSSWSGPPLPGTEGPARTSSSAAPMSLLEAMTLRLGKKVWFIDWKLRDAAMSLLVRRTPTDTPLLQFVLRASGNLKSFGIGKRDFCFIVSQCDITHGLQKVLFFGSRESFVFSEEDESPEENDDRMDLVAPIESMRRAVASRSSKEPLWLRGPDLVTPAQYLELPPPGTACRIVAGKDHDTFKISISAHPATLVWSNVLSDSVLETFSEHSSDLYGDLKQHIRNFATPMARKAQLALLSPGSLSLHLNIASPKVWVPIISGDAEGCLILDAGTLRMKSSKEEGDTEAQWNVQAREIGAKFVRGLNISRFTRDSFPSLLAFGAFPMSQGESVVVRPFSIDASSCILRGAVPIDAVFLADPIRNVEVTISPICLNLVDSEMIARLLGKLYARGLHRVRRESPPKDEVSGVAPMVESDLRLAFQDIKWSELPRIFTVHIEKIEIALEGHSKQAFSSDDRSMASLDTALQEYAPPTRAYLVEILHVTWKKSGLRHTEMTRFTIIDASIVRLRDVSQYTPLFVRRELMESENRIFVRASDETVPNPDETAVDGRPDNGPFAEFGPQPGIFRASLLHNRLSHLDEVEVDIDSVILRITPTTLKDCAKAFRRIMELTQLVTKEMERKVHEEGRKARRRTGTFFCLILSSKFREESSLGFCVRMC
jgi:Vacuolar sorting-associated protein 13, N-terminal/N-terminal region of Chorein or VPS13